MKKVWVYEVDEERLEDKSEKYNVTVPEIIEALLDWLDSEEKYNNDILKEYLP